jgi:methylphosphotriester-DNA--protein-cysteine methyltransferase
VSLPGTWALIGPDGKHWRSRVPGTLGGHRGSKIYGRFDCRTALQAIARGGYVKHRVFFLDEATAIAAGYRPCGVCLPEEHATWKGLRDLAALTQRDVARFEEPVRKTSATME